jgi:hypothetical protein
MFVCVCVCLCVFVSSGFAYDTSRCTRIQANCFDNGVGDSESSGDGDCIQFSSTFAYV